MGINKMSTTTSVSSSTNLKFIWPNGYGDCGLSTQDRVAIEESIKFCLPKEPDYPSSGYTYKIIKKNSWGGSCDNGFKINVKKTLFLTSKVAIVSLGIKDTQAFGAQQNKLTIGFDILSGDIYYKKQIFSHYEENLLKFIMSPANDSKSGFSTFLVYKYQSKSKCWEKKETNTLKEWMSTNEPLLLNNLASIQNSLRTLHSIHYLPACFKYKDQILTFDDAVRGCFHGDISPRNIVCTNDEKGNTTFKLIDYSGGDLKSLCWTRGWGSPEYVAYAQSKGPYKHLSTTEFNIKFGRQKDAWSLGLIIGSLLRRTGHEHISKEGKPCFSFILSRLKVSPEGILDDSAIADITQEEIDDKIREIKEQVKSTVSDKILQNSLLNWWSAINNWLTVDPMKRPNVSEVYITYS